MKTWWSLLPALLLLSAAPMAGAMDGFAGSKAIKLVQQDGTAHLVGTISFEPDGDGAHYGITWREDAFSEHFLSMRPFKCMEGSAKHWCRVPYPYENKRRISQGDLADLEYDLLFVWKGATEYGINLWNGVYYKLESADETLVGHLHEIDLGVLAAPPEDGNLRPVREQDLEPGDADSHWLPRLVIE